MRPVAAQARMIRAQRPKPFEMELVMVIAAITHAHITHATIGIWLGVVFVLYYCASTRKRAQSEAVVKEIA